MKKITTYLFSMMLLFSFAVIPVYALDGQNVNFDLHSIVYDDGEAIDSVVLKTSNLEIDHSKITKDMFKVHATGTTVYSSQLENEFFGPNSQSGLQHCGLYDEEREVESVEEKNGNIILHLVTNKETKGKNTLDFTANFTTLKGCNSLLNIKYEITLNKGLPLKDGSELSNIQFLQNEKIINEEIDKFSAGESNGLKYQFYTPNNANDGNKHPLIVWFHGGGESGFRGLHYNNLSQLKANRGAVALASDEAQNIFNGAYVLAPQTPHEWSENIDDATKLINNIIKNNNIDSNRIYSYGCSAGGYMALDMVVHNPNLFAAVVSTCPAIDQQNIKTYGEGRIITDEEIKSINIPTWVIQAKDDTTVKYEESALRVYTLLKDKGAILTTYETGGHSSWIHTAKNEPENNGEHLWQWTAKQSLNDEIKTPVENTIKNEPVNKTSAVKTGDTNYVYLYVVTGSISMAVMAEYIHNKNKKSITK